MEVDTSLVPYLVKKFKIMSMKTTKDALDVLYVNELSQEDIETLEGFIEKKVNFVQKVEEKEFWEIASEAYEDVSFPGVKKVNKEDDNSENEIEEKKYNEDKYIKMEKNNSEKEPTFQEDEGQKEDPLDNVDLSDIPMEYLVKEIRSRQIKTEAEAIIHITEDRNANFEFTKLSWPVGKFRVSMNIEEELKVDDVREN